MPMARNFKLPSIQPQQVMKDRKSLKVLNSVWEIPQKKTLLVAIRVGELQELRSFGLKLKTTRQKTAWIYITSWGACVSLGSKW